MGRQMLPSDKTTPGTKYEDPDLYFPLFTALQVSYSLNFIQTKVAIFYTPQFCFYVGKCFYLNLQHCPRQHIYIKDHNCKILDTKTEFLKMASYFQDG